MRTRTERRCHPRAPLDTEALIVCSTGQHSCRALDVSVGGLAIRCEPQVQLDHFVQIDFFLPDVAIWFSVEAEVVRVDGGAGPNKACLSFHTPDWFTVSHLESYVRDRLAPFLQLVESPEPLLL